MQNCESNVPLRLRFVSRGSRRLLHISSAGVPALHERLSAASIRPGARRRIQSVLSHPLSKTQATHYIFNSIMSIHVWCTEHKQLSRQT